MNHVKEQTRNSKEEIRDKKEVGKKGKSELQKRGGFVQMFIARAYKELEGGNRGGGRGGGKESADIFFGRKQEVKKRKSLEGQKARHKKHSPTRGKEKIGEEKGELIGKKKLQRIIVKRMGGVQVGVEWKK